MIRNIRTGLEEADILKEGVNFSPFDPDNDPDIAAGHLTSSLFLRVVDALDTATTLKELFDIFTNEMPVDIASYHHFPAVGAVDYKTKDIFHGYNLPVQIENYYRSTQVRQHNPSLKAILATSRFMWLSDLIEHPVVTEANYSDRPKAAFEMIGEGLCIPLFGPNNRNGYMFLAGRAFIKKDGCYFAHQVHALCQIFHVRFSMMIRKIQRQINLTEREAEVVELLTYGKTNSEIAEILDISTSTVAGYMKSIFLKLDVSDRVSASMRAQSIKVSL